MSNQPSKNQTLEDTFRKLAKSCRDYNEFREKALEATPDVLKASIGPHLSEFYLDLLAGE